MKPSRSQAVILAALVVACAGARAQAQAPRECLLQFEGGGATRTVAQKLPSERYNVFQGGGVTYHCEGQDNTLIADSAEYYGDQSVLYMIGNVHYRETRARVDSDRMTYYQTEDRLRAEGNVNVLLQSGTTMQGPVVEYFRVTPARPLARTEATGRPRMKLAQQQAGQPSEPVDVVANRILAEGDNLVYASGNVEITRPDVDARGDSAFMDGQREFARLMRSPVVQSRRGRPFTLRGGVIDLHSRQRALQRVVAAPNGHALSEDIELTSDTVDLRVSSDRLDRIQAWGRSRARAISPGREIVADSIDAQMPSQKLRVLHAVRNAFASSTPDTMRIVATERDWMSGDRITAEFDTVATRDTSAAAQARRIVATGNARSYYHIPSEGRGRTVPNLNYVTGRVITVNFDSGQVRTVDVLDAAQGVYLEAVPPPLEPATTRTPAGRVNQAPAAPRPGTPPRTRPPVAVPPRR